MTARTIETGDGNKRLFKSVTGLENGGMLAVVGEGGLSTTGTSLRALFHETEVFADESELMDVSWRIDIAMRFALH